MTLPPPPAARPLAMSALVLAAQLLGFVGIIALVAADGGLLSVVVAFERPLAADGSFGFVAGAGVPFSPEVAMLVPLGVAVTALAALRARRGALTASAASTLHWVSVSQSLGITIVIVAALNGVDEAATVVALYALAAGSGMLGWLSDRTPRHDGSRRHLWPYAFLTVLAIVPWGVVALVQVTGLIAGVPATAGVRTATLVILAATAAWAAAEWAIARPAGAARDARGAARLRIASSTALASIPSGAVVVLGLLGG
ncbi:hypothetical protein EV141_0224 [Microcella putealis]|uniref:Uncharacterized protein n=1 Tax=Microcella putealis TaxID=337005 RepID=A0A4Q7LYB0_9MICO|nr:hypothetical protein [Microcella putealis]RZS59009.1 hypothetical protein EV141_0224 [Microcella putealis]TQM24035.1 hypothetical protein BJ957_1503 [Microcella putealis]